MNHANKNDGHKGVVCLFCGTCTSLSAQAQQRHAAHPDEHRVSIIRCQLCGKEAVYLSAEIVDTQAA